MEAVDNSECLEKFLKFPVPDKIEPLIRTATNFKINFALKKDSNDLIVHKKIETQAKSRPINSNWLFNTGSPIKPQNEESKKFHMNELNEEKLKIINDIKSCIEVIENEKKFYDSSNIEKCLKLLNEISEEMY